MHNFVFLKIPHNLTYLPIKNYRKFEYKQSTMKYILTLLTALLSYSASYSCSCSVQADARSFCQVMGAAQSQPMFCVVQAKVVSWYHWGMRVKVLSIVRGNPISDTITVWGDNGALCRPPVSAAFLLGDTIVMCLEQTDFMGNTIAPSQPDYELPDHYMLQGCGTYFLRCQNGKVMGSFDDNTHPDTMSYEDFATRVHHCIEAAAIPNAPANAEVAIYPNPSADMVWLDAPSTYNTVSLYNSLGQCVLTQPLTTKHTSINLTHFASGVYSLTLSSTDKSLISHYKIVRQ